MPIRLIATDLDGTLLRGDLSVSPARAGLWTTRGPPGCMWCRSPPDSPGGPTDR
ncbi:hypothetical protein ACFSC4_16840 [Deinococcus malanensis]|uniref:hypothetical protein n=1 Tax=Deinococcus malanensis TaxID=1706855 RepID=UPI0036354995